MIHAFYASAKHMVAYGGKAYMYAHAMEIFLTRLRELAPLAVALSGGLDSRFLAHAARLANCDTLLLHASGSHVSPRESEGAKLWAAGQGLPLRVISFDPLALPAVAENTRERCYFCKKALLETLRPHAAGYTLCDGTQADDLLHPHRPGQRALKEAGLRSLWQKSVSAKRKFANWPLSPVWRKRNSRPVPACPPAWRTACVLTPEHWRGWPPRKRNWKMRD